MSPILKLTGGFILSLAIGPAIDKTVYLYRKLSRQTEQENIFLEENNSLKNLTLLADATLEQIPQRSVTKKWNNTIRSISPGNLGYKKAVDFREDLLSCKKISQLLFGVGAIGIFCSQIIGQCLLDNSQNLEACLSDLNMLFTDANLSFGLVLGGYLISQLAAPFFNSPYFHFTFVNPYALNPLKTEYHNMALALETLIEETKNDPASREKVKTLARKLLKNLPIITQELSLYAGLPTKSAKNITWHLKLASKKALL